jgi:uroporphyrinogen decarboxylase
VRDLDVEAFWQENDRCLAPFSTAKPRVPLTFWLDDHFIHGVVDLPSTARYYHDVVYRLSVHRACNRRLRPALGRDFYPEDRIQYQKGEFEVLCGARRVIQEGMTPWIESSITSIDDVKALTSRLASLDIREAAISDAMLSTRSEFEQQTGARLIFEHSWTGPATLTCNILGTTNVCLFMMDETDAMDAFMTVLCDRYIAYREAVVSADNGRIDRAGIGVNDDCCYLFPPRLYERLCAPFLERFLAAFAPQPQHKRRQHSDSPMGHLMPILNDLGVNEVNFGPTLHPVDIRRAMPKAVIHGQTPPFVLRDGSADNIIAAVRRDIESVGGDGGLVECPAGAVVLGTPLDNVRTYMWAVETYGRYG